MTAQIPLRFSWLRESSPGRLETDVDLHFSSDELPLALMSLHPLQHGPERDSRRLTAQLESGLASVECFEALPGWMRDRLRTFFGPLNSPPRLEAARANLELTHQVSEVVARKASQIPREAVIQLPYFDRKAWLQRFDRLGEMVFEINADGRILDRRSASDPVVHGAGEMMTAIAPALQNSPAPSASHEGTEAHATMTVAAADKRIIGAANARAALLQILADFGLQNALEGHAGDLEATLVLRAPAAAGAAWADAPVGRSADFIPIYSRFSVLLQLALRRWLMWFYFSGEQGCAQWNTALALLAYSATKPFVAQTRSAFSYDVLDHRKMASLCASASRKLPEMAQRAGMAPNSGLCAAEAAKWPAGDARAFPSLLFGEAQIVDECLRAAQRIRMCVHARNLSRTAEDFVAAVDRKFRAVLRRCGVYSPAPPILAIEILAALSVARGGPGAELELKLVSAAKSSVHRNTITRCDSLSPI